MQLGAGGVRTHDSWEQTMNLTTKEWIRHLRNYIETHGDIAAPSKSYILVVLDYMEKSLTVGGKE